MEGPRGSCSRGWGKDGPAARAGEGRPAQQDRASKASRSPSCWGRKASRKYIFKEKPSPKYLQFPNSCNIYAEPTKSFPNPPSVPQGPITEMLQTPKAWPCYKGLILIHKTCLLLAFQGVAESSSLHTFDHTGLKQVVSKKHLADPASGLCVFLTARPQQHVCGEESLRR